MSHIPVTIACEKLGITSSAICVSKKYKPFYHKRTEGKKDASFDMDGFIKKENLINELKQQTSLFTEYLIHERGWTYQRIADEAKVSFQAINNCSLGYKTSLQLAYRFKHKHPSDFKAFHKYYGYKETA